MYKPTRVQGRYRDLLFQRFPQDAIPAELGVEQKDIDDWFDDGEFADWLYEGIIKVKHRFGVPIIVQLAEDAAVKGAAFQLRELALRVLGLYMPTAKTIRDKDVNEQKKRLADMKKKAKDLQKVQEAQTN